MIKVIEEPSIKIAKYSRQLVLFSSPKTGVVINEKGKEIGYFAEDWIPEAFETFNGRIILENDS